MPAKIMDGRILAQKIKLELKEQVRALNERGIEPSLTTILVGKNPASVTYLRNKHSACAEVGIVSHNTELPAETSQMELEDLISRLNDDQSVSGILLQLPLPKGLDDSATISLIAPGKDVDGLNPRNLGLLFGKTAKLVPCTPKGVMAMLKYYGVEIAGGHAVIINRSKLVGRPLSQLMLNEDATVTVCHSKTHGLMEIARTADILITGIGHRSEFAVTAQMVKPEAAVVDVGISSVGGRLMGDVDFASAAQVAKYISPVPGGVGPLTIAMLLYNTLLAACIQNQVEMHFNPEELDPLSQRDA